MKTKDKRFQGCQFFLGRQEKDPSCPFISGKLLNHFPKIHSSGSACFLISLQIQPCFLIKKSVIIKGTFKNERMHSMRTACHGVQHWTCARICMC